MLMMPNAAKWMKREDVVAFEPVSQSASLPACHRVSRNLPQAKTWLYIYFECVFRSRILSVFSSSIFWQDIVSAPRNQNNKNLFFIYSEQSPSCWQKSPPPRNQEKFGQFMQARDWYKLCNIKIEFRGKKAWIKYRLEKKSYEKLEGTKVYPFL